MKRITIVGCGYVGSAYAAALAPTHDIVRYDPFKGLHDHDVRRAHADLAIICVPTPMSPNGSCDISAVEDAIKHTPAQVPLILIKSTVPPGTTAELAAKYHRSICFSPEYIGEGKYFQPVHYPNPRDPFTHGFMIVGGDLRDCEQVIDILLPAFGPNTRYRIMASAEAETVKYAENAFLALKVMFANELREICEGFGVSYHNVREGWLDDPRVGTSHSVAFKDRPGFDGKCLPKDTAALQYVARLYGVETPLLSALIEANKR